MQLRGILRLVNSFNSTALMVWSRDWVNCQGWNYSSSEDLDWLLLLLPHVTYGSTVEAGGQGEERF